MFDAEYLTLRKWGLNKDLARLITKIFFRDFRRKRGLYWRKLHMDFYGHTTSLRTAINFLPREYDMKQVAIYSQGSEDQGFKWVVVSLPDFPFKHDTMIKDKQLCRGPGYYRYKWGRNIRITRNQAC